MVRPAPSSTVPANALNRPMPRASALALLHQASQMLGDGKTPATPQPVANGGGESAVQIIAAFPQSDAAQRICGADATVCAVWWPTANGDQAQYDECMQQVNADAGLGQTPDEYCHMMWGGDCAGTVAPGTTADLCSLISGMGVHWTTGYLFGSFVTWGDCSHFTPVKDLVGNLAGLQLILRAPALAGQLAGTNSIDDAPFAADDQTAAASVCAATLYLLAPA